MYLVRLVVPMCFFSVLAKKLIVTRFVFDIFYALDQLKVENFVGLYPGQRVRFGL